jgi:hypothetical protein
MHIDCVLMLLTPPQVVQDKISRKIQWCMIDKSKTEIAALTALGITHVLCLFHMLQDWERYLRSAESGVKDPEERLAILSRLKQLALSQDVAWFNNKEASLKDM